LQRLKTRDSCHGAKQLPRAGIPFLFLSELIDMVAGAILIGVVDTLLLKNRVEDMILLKFCK